MSDRTSRGDGKLKGMLTEEQLGNPGLQTAVTRIRRQS